MHLSGVRPSPSFRILIRSRLTFYGIPVRFSCEWQTSQAIGCRKSEEVNRKRERNRVNGPNAARISFSLLFFPIFRLWKMKRISKGQINLRAMRLRSEAHTESESTTKATRRKNKNSGWERATDLRFNLFTKNEQKQFLQPETVQYRVAFERRKKILRFDLKVFFRIFSFVRSSIAMRRMKSTEFVIISRIWFGPVFWLHNGGEYRISYHLRLPLFRFQLAVRFISAVWKCFPLLCAVLRLSASNFYNFRFYFYYFVVRNGVLWSPRPFISLCCHSVSVCILEPGEMRSVQIEHNEWTYFQWMANIWSEDRQRAIFTASAFVWAFSGLKGTWNDHQWFRLVSVILKMQENDLLMLSSFHLKDAEKDRERRAVTITTFIQDSSRWMRVFAV